MFSNLTNRGGQDRYLNFRILVYIIWAIVVLLNSNSQFMPGVYDHYLDIRRILIAGYDVGASQLGKPAFPMWGYSWLLMLTENTASIYFFQLLLCIISVEYFIIQSATVFDHEGQKSRRFNIVLFVLLSVSFSWISIQATKSPYGISISLMIILYVSLIKSLHSYYYLILAAVAYGFLLNFRSDYLYFIILIYGIFIIYSDKLIDAIRKIVTFSIFTFLLLLPWVSYTYHVVGVPLLSSTNSGHVLYIGLGNLPNNKWGITEDDHDPKMYEELYKEFGSNVSSLTHKPDIFLKKRFLEMVTDDPIEYSKKIVYSLIRSFVAGIYVPEFFFLGKECADNCREVFISDVKTKPFAVLFEKNKTLLYILTYFSIFVGLILNAIGYFLSFFYVVGAIAGKIKINLGIALALSFVFYQLAINSMAFHMKVYSTYSYFFGLIIISIALVNNSKIFHNFKK